MTSGTPERLRLGGKGANLLALSERGLPVPAFFVVPVDEPADSATVLEGRRALGNGPVAVRSSATAEDLGAASFAGQFDTVLWVQTDAELVAAVAHCRRSLDSERVRAYCAHHGIERSALGMAVVVQRMVDAVASGVLFTVDPAHPDSGESLISAAWGLGEGVVSGQVDTDTYRVRGPRVSAEIVTKGMQVRPRPTGSGTALVEVPPDRRCVRCVSDDQCRRLVAFGRQLEAHYGVPQDIEWALDAAGELHILQTRPLTGVGPRVGTVATWDNSNIIESYSGVTTPLTYTFARNAYEVVYRQFCEVMGVADADLAKSQAVFKRMIGLIRGRIYYCLDSWYRVLALLPGARFNKRFMEQMMGVRKEADLEGERPSTAGKLRIYYLAWRVLRSLFGLGRRTADFSARFADTYGQYQAQDLEALPPDALAQAYRDLEQRLLLHWKAPIINDFFAMIFFGVLKKMAAGHHNDLLAGEPGMESTVPTREQMRMAARVRASPELTRAFATMDDDSLASEALAGNPALRELRAWLLPYLQLFGDRCMEELKLETRTLRDDSAFLMGSVRRFVARPDLTVERMDDHERSVRAEAEAAVAGAIPLLKRPLFRWVLSRARRHVRDRENLRFARTRVFGLVRRLFRAIGGHLARQGHLDAVEDVFYLTLEEVLGAVEGTTPTAPASFRALTRLRRAEFDRYRREPPPSDRFETRGAVHLGNPFRDLTPVELPADPDALVGLGCAPGVVREQVRVVRSPKDVPGLDGKILVCERTDPGWVPLFPTAAGLLVERGSALSHSAIVAREFGIPTIVGIPRLLERVSDGALVEMDGATGVARVVREVG